MESSALILTRLSSVRSEAYRKLNLTPDELQRRLYAIVKMPLGSKRTEKEIEFFLDSMNAGWLSFAATELLLESEGRGESFNLREFILHQSGIDVDRPFTFLRTSHGVYHWYQNPAEGVS